VLAACGKRDAGRWFGEGSTLSAIERGRQMRRRHPYDSGRALYRHIDTYQSLGFHAHSGFTFASEGHSLVDLAALWGLSIGPRQPPGSPASINPLGYPKFHTSRNAQRRLREASVRQIRALANQRRPLRGVAD